MRRIIVWAGIIILLGGLVWGLAKLADMRPIEPGVESGASLPKEKIITASDWVRGSRNAKVIITEYSDLQCPACGTHYPFLKKIESEFSGQVALVYRHFPLQSLHQYAVSAAKAAEAAGKENKFWEMHDMLFEHQAEWTNAKVPAEQFIEYAKTIGLDEELFKKNSATKELEDKIIAHYREGVTLGVTYAPTLYVNGKKINNPPDYEGSKKIISDTIKNA